MTGELKIYVRSAEFWQCTVFLAWALFELAITSARVASFGRTGIIFAILLMTGASLFLTKAFVSVVRFRLENPGNSKSRGALIFLYTAGTLAISLQTILYVTPRHP